MKKATIQWVGLGIKIEEMHKIVHLLLLFAGIILGSLNEGAPP